MAQPWITEPPMTNRFTYKELTLLLGIVVAAIILLNIWLQPAAVESSEAGTSASPNWLIPSVKMFIHKIGFAFQLSR